MIKTRRIEDNDVEINEVSNKKEEVKSRNIAFTDADYKLVEQELKRVAFKAKTSERKQTIHLYDRKIFYYLIVLVATSGLRAMEANNIICWKVFKLYYKGKHSPIKSTSACTIAIRNSEGKARRKVVCDAGYTLQAFRSYVDKWKQERGYRSVKGEVHIFTYPVTDKPYTYSLISNYFRKLMAKLTLNGKGYTIRSHRSTYIYNMIKWGANPYKLCRNTGHNIQSMIKHKERLGITYIADHLP